MKKNELTTLTSTELNDIGINTQLSSNDLVEIIATDIYNNIMNHIESLNNRNKDLLEKYRVIHEEKVEKFIELLKKKGFLTASSKYSSRVDYKIAADYDFIQILKIKLDERKSADKVILVDNNNSSFLKSDAVCTLSIFVRDYGVINSTKNGITIQERKNIDTTFSTEVKISAAPYISLRKEFEQHNKEVRDFFEKLPKTLSIDAFIREARTKLNRKIISGQSPEFRQKISELFKINI